MSKFIKPELEYVKDIVEQLDQIQSWVSENGFGRRGLNSPYHQQHKLIEAAELLSRAEDILAEAKRWQIKFRCEQFAKIHGAELCDFECARRPSNFTADLTSVVKVLNGWASHADYEMADSVLTSCLF